MTKEECNDGITRFMKASIISLGCKVNQSEGEEIAVRLKDAGVAKALRGEHADIIIVNTCTVTGEADRKSRKLIYQAVKKKNGPKAIVAVTGCYAEVAANALRDIPGVDLVVPQTEKDKLVEIVLSEVASASSGSIGDLAMAESPDTERVSCLSVSGLRSPVNRRHRAYLKVQDGCDNRCAYCIVPDARGKPRSVPEAEILTKAASFAASGTRELVLTGINIGKYGDLTGLIKRIYKMPGLERIRLSSIEPEDVTDELIEMLKKDTERHPHPSPLPSRERNSSSCSTLYAIGSQLQGTYLCPHLHIPLQSDDDETLKRMRRRYTAAGYRKIIDKVRAACPGVAITTDVIVGFPGETDDEFRNTYRFLEKAELARLHVFKYSKRAGTPAADMPGQVPAKVKAERSEALRELSGRLEAGYRKMFIGRELDVLVEKASGNLLTGTSENYLTVSFEGEANQVGQIVRVRLAE